MSSPSKTLVKFLLAFVVATFAGDRLLAKAGDQVLARSGFRYSRLYYGKCESDVLILGNSRAVAGFLAPHLSQVSDREVFNLGYNGVKFDLLELVLLDYLERHPAPKKALIEVSGVAAKDELINQFRLYRDRSQRLASMDQAQLPKLATASQAFSLLNYNNEFFLRSLYYLGRSDQSWGNHGVISDDYLNHVKSSPNTELRLLPESLAALVRIVNTLVSHEVEVVLVVAPYLPLYARKIDDYEGWKGRILKALPPGFEIHDYSQAIEGNRFFADSHHINTDGAKTFAKKLEADGLLR